MKSIYYSLLLIIISLSVTSLAGSCTGSRHFLNSDLEEELMQRRTVENLEGKEEFLITEKKIRPLKKREYYWYRAGKVNHTRSNYAGKLLDGVYTRFYEDHSLREKGNFKNGIKTGTWYHWHPDGRISKKEKFNKNGYLDGYYAVLDEKGDLIYKGHYRNGLKQGRWIDYNTEDTLYYKKGEIKTIKKRTGLLNRILKKKDTLSKDTTKSKDSLGSGFFKRIFQKDGQEKIKKEKVKGDSKKSREKNKDIEKSKKEGFLEKLFKRKPKKTKD